MQKLKNYKKILLIFLGLIIIAGIFFLIYLAQSRLKNTTDNLSAVSVDQTKEFNQSGGDITTQKTITSEEKSTLPDKYLLKVAFQSQAPYGDWSEPYENACEEASIITVEHYLSNQGLSKEQMKSEIDSSVA